MGDLNLRNLETVLDSLKHNANHIIELLGRITKSPPAIENAKPEEAALYSNALKLFEGLPKKHPLKKSYQAGMLKQFLKVLTDGEMRVEVQNVLMYTRGNLVTVTQPCCVDRIANEVYSFFSSNSSEFDAANTPRALREHEDWKSLKLRAFTVENALYDDGEPAKRAMRAYVAHGNPYGVQGEIRLCLDLPLKIAGLEELLDKYNFVSTIDTDEIYFEYGVPKNHPDYEMIVKGNIPLNDYGNRCVCPKQAIIAPPSQDALAALSKKYVLSDKVVADAQHLADIALNGNPHEGWEGKEWRFVLPTPVSQTLTDHLSHSARDAMHALGRPKDVEWHTYGFPFGEAAVVVLTCAYKKQTYSSKIWTPEAPPIDDVIKQVLQAVDITDSAISMQIHAMKEPGKKWEPYQRPSQLLL